MNHSLWWLMSLPLEVSKLVYAWLEGVELFSRKSTVRVLGKVYKISTIRYSLYHMAHILFCDLYFKKLNIQNLSWKRSLASAKKQSWILSNFELSVIDFSSWLQIQKSNTWRRKRNLISLMNYCKDQWYPTVKAFIAVMIWKLKNIALYLQIRKLNTPNKLTIMKIIFAEW